MIVEFFSILFLLIVAHYVADYPLQGDFLAKGKNHKNPIPGVPWYQCLIAHSAIHSGAVFLITGFYILALLEFVVHFIIDFTKCSEQISYNTDQHLHILTKIVIAALYVALI